MLWDGDGGCVTLQKAIVIVYGDNVSKEQDMRVSLCRSMRVQSYSSSSPTTTGRLSDYKKQTACSKEVGGRLCGVKRRDATLFRATFRKTCVCVSLNRAPTRHPHFRCSSRMS